MIYTIENDKIKVDFSDIGGEMQSLVNKANGTTYIRSIADRSEKNNIE